MFFMFLLKQWSATRINQQRQFFSCFFGKYEHKNRKLHGEIINSRSRKLFLLTVVLISYYTHIICKDSIFPGGYADAH